MNRVNAIPALNHSVMLPHIKKPNLRCDHESDWLDLEHETGRLPCGNSLNRLSALAWADPQSRLWIECGAADDVPG